MIPDFKEFKAWVPQFKAWDNKKKEFVDEATIIFYHSDTLRVSVADRYDAFVRDFELIPQTGFSDSDGDDIYAGDILCVYHDNFSAEDAAIEYIPHIGVVTYENAKYIVKTNDGYDPELSSDALTEIKIIGNIYESPDMMKNLKQSKEEL